MNDTTPDGAAADAARPTLPPPAPAQASPAPPASVQLLDRLGDIVGVIAITVLCLAGKIGGIEAVVAIGALLGVGTGLRQAGARAGVAAGLGVVGLLALAAPRWGAALASGAVAAARAGGLAALVLLAALSIGCSGGAAGAAGAALKTAEVVVNGARFVRRAICAPDLDPILGNPRDEVSADTPRSSGGQAPAPPPAPSSPPALPPPTAATPAATPSPTTLPAGDQDGG